VSESPLIQEIVTDSKREERIQATIDVLAERFGNVPPAITAGLQQLQENERHARLTRRAVSCHSPQAFGVSLRKELPQAPAP
jgi:hypothetical protein